MAHILNISTHYIQTKSYFGIKQMMRNSEKLMNLDFEIKKFWFYSVVMTAIGDSIRYVNKIKFYCMYNCSKEKDTILEFFSKMEYPVDIAFDTISDDSLNNLVEISKNKRFIEKKFHLRAYYPVSEETLVNVIKFMEPTIFEYSLYRENYRGDIKKILKALENTRVERINFLDKELDDEIRIDLSKYPKLKYISVCGRSTYCPDKSPILFSDIDKPFELWNNIISTRAFANFPDNLSFPYLDKIVANSDLKIFEGKIFPKTIIIPEGYESLHPTIDWPSVEIIRFSRMPRGTIEWKFFPNLKKVIISNNSFREGFDFAPFGRFPESAKIEMESLLVNTSCNFYNCSKNTQIALIGREFTQDDCKIIGCNNFIVPPNFLKKEYH